jgi:ATP-dependent Clp protease protease subunit
MPEAEREEKLPKFVNDKLEHALLEKRRVFLSDGVDSDSAKDIIRKLWYLDTIAPGKPILFIINSPGGSVDSGFAIWDQIKMLSSPVITLVTGLAALIGGVIRGQATDLEIQAKEMLKTRDVIVDIYSESTGKDRKAIEKAIDRDNWMTAEEALEFGLLDKIVLTMKDVDDFLR